LDLLEDLVVDVPKAPAFAAAFIANAILDEYFPIQQLQQLLGPLEGSNSVAEVAAGVFATLIDLDTVLVCVKLSELALSPSKLSRRCLDDPRQISGSFYHQINENLKI